MNFSILATVLFLATPPPTTLQHRTGPPVHPETCRDHLARVKASLLSLTDPTGNIAKNDADYARKIHDEALGISPAVDGIPSSPYCTKKALDRLDIFNSLLNFQDATYGLP